MAAVISRYGFPAEQIENPDRITAFVETWKEHNQKAGGFSEPMGTYGITWAGRGMEGTAWGGGFARNPEPLIAHGLVRLLAKFPTTTLLAHVHKEFWKHVAPGTGHVRWSDGSTHGFKPILEAAHALDAGRLRLELQDKPGKHNMPRPRVVASNIAQTHARVAITELRQRDPLAIPALAIVVEG